jgi:hypothetical protein
MEENYIDDKIKVLASVTWLHSWQLLKQGSTP